MNILELLEKKRDGQELDRQDIDYFIEQISRDAIPDYQAAAMLMAITINGMSARETADLTRAMTFSGRTINLDDIPGPKVDKHSTGGVGDKVSLVLAPLAAAAGIKVPMISGRSLGHTGGTLDKLESIPGFRTDLSIDTFKTNIRDIGACIIGQTDELVPADRVLYSLRDTTATVPSIPLITSSILCKKLAEGIDALVLDIKVGSGGFLNSLSRAEKLAQSMLHTASLNDLPLTVVLSDMDQPLGNTAGNWIEVMESVEVLRGNGPQDLVQLSEILAAHMLRMATPGMDEQRAINEITKVLENGSAYDKFIQIIKAQGGDTSVFNRMQYLHRAEHTLEITAPTSGYVSAIATKTLGNILTELGGGRRVRTDKIDPAAGFRFHAKKGDHVKTGQILMTVYHNKTTDDLYNRLQDCYTITENKSEVPPLIYKTLTSKGQ